MTTGLYLLRAVQCGVALRDLELLTVGMLMDMFTEAENDGVEYDEIGTDEDVDRL